MGLRRTGGALVSALVLALAACGGDGAAAGTTAGSPGAAPGGGSREPVALRLGMSPNLTHATALAAIERGIFADHLAEGATLEARAFGAGPLAVEALFTGAVDAAYIGPNPAVNAFAKSGGEAVRVVAGATSGGSFLVVRPGITSPDDLHGVVLATPQLGNSQDIALRSWLEEQGLRADTTGGGDVSIRPQESARALAAFTTGGIDGAWVPEPWATRLVEEAGAEVLVDERDLWPGGEHVTTQLVVATSFLEEHPGVVEQLLAGHVAATRWVNEQPAEAQAAVNARIEALTGERLDGGVLAAAWENLTFTVDPLAPTLRGAADRAAAVGLLDEVDLAGIHALGPLDEVLAEAGEPSVAEP